MSRALAAAVLAVLFACSLYGCGGSSSKSSSVGDAATQRSSDDERDLVGYWRGEKGGGPLNFHFASDGTGWVSETGEMRTLRWSATNQRLTIAMDASASGADWEGLSGRYDWAGSTLVLYHEYHGYRGKVMVVPSFYSRVQ